MSRSFLPDVAIKVIGDGAYSGIELGLTCVKLQVSLIAPLRLDARLFAPPPAPRPHQMGRPPLVGKRLPKLTTVLHDSQTEWERLTVNGYGGTQRTLARHHRHGALVFDGDQPAAHSALVLTRDPEGKWERHPPTSPRIKRC